MNDEATRVVENAVDGLENGKSTHMVRAYVSAAQEVELLTAEEYRTLQRAQKHVDSDQRYSAKSLLTELL